MKLSDRKTLIYFILLIVCGVGTLISISSFIDNFKFSTLITIVLFSMGIRIFLTLLKGRTLSFHLQIRKHEKHTEAPQENTLQDYEKEREKRQENIERQRRQYEKQYDFNSVEGIMAIPVPDYSSPKAQKHYDRMGSIEYYLNLKAHEYKKAGNMDLAIACFRKANEIYPKSPYPQKEYVYLKAVECLKDAGKFEEARAEKAYIEEHYKPYFVEYILPQYKDDPDAIENYIHSPVNQFLIDYHQSDLISTFPTAPGHTCAECSKYRGRIYSLYGWDPRFPKFPDKLRKMYIHKHCEIGFQAIALHDEFDSLHYLLGYDPDKRFSSLNALIRYCNRPFADDRTQAEKEQFFLRQKDSITREKNSDDFDWIREFLPETAPKSLTRYITMKNKRNATYQMLLTQAKAKGRDLDAPVTEEQRKDLPISQAQQDMLALSAKQFDDIKEQFHTLQQTLAVVQTAEDSREFFHALHLLFNTLIHYLDEIKDFELDLELDALCRQAFKDSYRAIEGQLHIFDNLLKSIDKLVDDFLVRRINAALSVQDYGIFTLLYHDFTIVDAFRITPSEGFIWYKGKLFCDSNVSHLIELAAKYGVLLADDEHLMIEDKWMANRRLYRAIEYAFQHGYISITALCDDLKYWRSEAVETLAFMTKYGLVADTEDNDFKLTAMTYDQFRKADIPVIPKTEDDIREEARKQEQSEKQAQIAALDDSALLNAILPCLDTQTLVSEHLIIKKSGCSKETAARFITLMMDSGRLKIDHYYYDGVPCYKLLPQNSASALDADDILAQIDNSIENEWGFEQYAADLLLKNGFVSVDVTNDSDRSGVNLIALDTSGIQYAVQCKQHTTKLSVKPVQKLITGMAQYPCTVGIILTNQYFTNNAIELAEMHGILLWNRDKLKSMIEHAVIETVVQ